MISFAGKVKNELCRVGIGRQCCARAEGYGVLLYGNTFTPGEIRIITENGDFAARLPKLFIIHLAVSMACGMQDHGLGSCYMSCDGGKL